MRCTGHCCRMFTLPGNPEMLASNKHKWNDQETIQPMLIYLGYKYFDVWTDGRKKKQHYYTCRNFNTKTNNCEIYEKRPAMCRDFPYDNLDCTYKNCTLVKLKVI